MINLKWINSFATWFAWIQDKKQGIQPTKSQQQDVQEKKKIVPLSDFRNMVDKTGNTPKEIADSLISKWYEIEWMQDAQKDFAQTNYNVEQRKIKQLEKDKTTVWDIAQWVWVGIWTLWAWIWASSLVWKWLETGGKKLYWLTLPPITQEARKIIDAKVKGFDAPRTTVESALETPLTKVVWTRENIGITAWQEARKIYENTINPVMQELDQEWVTKNINEMFSKVEDNINKWSLWVKRQAELMEWLEALKEEYSAIWKTDFLISELDIEKKWLAEFIPQKAFKWKEISSQYWAVKKLLSDVMRNEVHTTISKLKWVDSAKLYKDYANLNNLKEIAVKALSESWKKGWTWWLLSTIYEELFAPVSTIVWKAAYKAGKWLQKVPKAVIEMTKKIPWLAENLWKTAVKWMKMWWKMFSMLDDWSLIPWSPTNIASKVINWTDEDWISVKNPPIEWMMVEKWKFKKIWDKELIETDMWFVDKDGNLFM